MHETGLDVGADQDAEPDQIDSKPIGGGRQQWNDDECDLEEIEEERDHEDKRVDEYQEPDLSAGQRGEQVLDPDLAADALEHQAENTRADQDVNDHRGDPHG